MLYLSIIIKKQTNIIMANLELVQPNKSDKYAIVCSETGSIFNLNGLRWSNEGSIKLATKGHLTRLRATGGIGNITLNCEIKKMA